MKKTFRIFIIAFLIGIFVYTCKIDSIPENIILYNEEELNLEKFLGIIIERKENKISAVSATAEEINASTKLDVKLFNLVKVKEISVKAIEETSVIPVGQVSGLKLYTSSALVVGMGEIRGEDNKKHKPYENSGIQEGDRIIKVNGIEIEDTNKLIELVNKSNGNTLKLEYVRRNEILKSNITPIRTSDGSYKLGLWVRDSAAGIGTLTFYEPKTRKFCSIRSWNYRYRYRRIN